MSTESQTRVIRVEVKGQGDVNLKKITNELGTLNRQAKSLSSVGSKLNAALNFGFLGIGIQQIANAADSINLLRDRIDQLSGGVDQGQAVFNRLVQAATRTKTSVESLSTIYARLAVTTKDLGVNQEQLFRVTEALQNSFRLSGATTAEATSAAIQLSQGFASGQLRGQELRSVLEANVVVGELLGKTFGVTRGELFKLAEEGRLGAGKVFKALLDSSEDLQKQADGLSVTFGQVFTQALDRARIAVAEFSRELGLASGLAKALNFIISKFKEIVFVTGVALIAFFKSQIVAALSAATTAVLTFGAALASFALANPLTALLAGIGIVLGGLLIAFGDLGKVIDFIQGSIAQLVSRWLKNISGFAEILAGLFGEKAQNNVKEYFREVTLSLDRIAQQNKGQATEILPFSSSIDFRRAVRQAENDIKLVDKQKVEQFSEINRLFKEGKIDLEEYARRLNLVQAALAKVDFDKGKKSVFAFREEIRQVQELEINKEFEQGAVSIDRLNQEILKLRGEELRDKFLQGKIGALELREELEKLERKLAPGNFFQEGIKSYLDTVKTLSEELSTVVASSFKNLEDAIFQTTKNGKFAFKDFAQSVLDDLTKVFIRTQVVAQLAEGLSTFGASLAASFAPAQGVGGANPNFGSALQPFADGGVVSRATPFMFANKLGVAGEAGPEAIMPLRRMPNGEMGVAASGGGSNVTINVINNSNSSIEQRESVDSNGQKIIDIIVLSKVKEGFSKGLFDKELNNSFGIKRRGV